MKQLYRNIGFTGVSQFVYTLMAFILVPFIARYLKSDGYGLYNLATILGFFFGLLSDLGVTTLLTVEVAKNKLYVGKLLATAMGLKLLLIGPAAAVIFFYLRISRIDAAGSAAVMIFTVSSLFASFSGSFFSIFRGCQRMEFETIVTILDKFLSVALGIFFLVRGYGIHVFLMSFVIAEAAKFVLSVFILQKNFTPIRAQFSLHRFRPLFVKSIPFGLSVFLAVCYNYTAILMLTSFTGMTEVGLYSASFKFLTLTTIIPTVLATAFLPQLSELRYSRAELTDLFIEGVRYLFFFSIPMVPFVAFNAKAFIGLVFGSDFNGSVLLLQVLVWAAFAQMTNIFFVSLYTALGRQKIIVYFQLIGLGLNLPLNLILIRSHASLGAAFATVATEWSILLMVAGFAGKTLLDRRRLAAPLVRYVAKTLTAASAMSVAGVLLRHWTGNAAVSIAGTVFVYLLVAQANGAMALGRLLQVVTLSAGRKLGNHGKTTAGN